MDVSFKENRAQQKALDEARKLLKSTQVEVGLPESAPARSRWLLALHERGAPGAHIPPRPVVGPALAKEETQAAVADGLLSACDAASKGDPEGVLSGFEEAGQAGADGIRAYIDSHIPPPNSPATVNGGWIWNRAAKKAAYVKGKGFNKPLFDTGALYVAFGYEIEE